MQQLDLDLTQVRRYILFVRPVTMVRKALITTEVVNVSVLICCVTCEVLTIL